MIKLSNILKEIEIGLPPEGKIRSKDIFIQKNGGNLKAYKFNSVNGIDIELERIYDDYNFNYDNYISNSDYVKTINQYGNPEDVFEDIYGINPLLLKDFFKTNTLKEIEVGMGGGPRVYANESRKDLFKIENFPVLQDKERIKVPGFTNVKRKVDPQFWKIIDKIQDYSPKNKRPNPDISFSGDFSTPGTSYVMIEDPGVFTVIETLEHLGKDEDWDLSQDWKEI